MATQNTQKITLMYQKSPGAGGQGNLDLLFQLFTQYNALVSDSQNYAYNSSALTSGATTVPSTGANLFGLAGGVYVRLATGSAFPVLTGAVIGDGKFGIYYFTVDNAAVQRSYPSSANSAATRAALTLPTVGANEIVVGAIEFAPVGATFTPGVDNINKASVNATVFNFTGDTGFTAKSLVELQVN